MTQCAFDQCLNAVEGVAESLGYKRVRSRFRQQMGEAATEVWYQRSRSSGENAVKFTVNLSITLLPLLGPGLLGSLRRTGAEPHWTERLGFLLPVQDDFWWEVDAGSAPVVAQLHAHLFADVVHPALLERSSVSWHVSEWRQARARWTTEKQWRSYLRRAEELGY